MTTLVSTLRNDDALPVYCCQYGSHSVFHNLLIVEIETKSPRDSLFYMCEHVGDGVTYFVGDATTSHDSIWRQLHYVTGYVR